MADFAPRTLKESLALAQEAQGTGCLPGCFYPPHPSGVDHREDCPNIPTREAAWYAVSKHVSNGRTCWAIVDDLSVRSVLAVVERAQAKVSGDARG